MPTTKSKLKSTTLPILPIPDKSLQGNSRAHWRTKSKAFRIHKTDAYLTIKQSNPAPFSKRTAVKITIYILNDYATDIDNIGYGCKAYIDGIVEAGLIHDDSPKYLKSITYKHVYKKNDKGIVIVIKPVYE